MGDGGWRMGDGGQRTERVGAEGRVCLRVVVVVVGGAGRGGGGGRAAWKPQRALPSRQGSPKIPQEGHGRELARWFGAGWCAWM